MSRLIFLAAALGLFVVASRTVRLQAVPPKWRVRLGSLALFGTFVSTLSILAALLLPEVLVVSSVRELWTTCTVAFRAIWEGPVGRWPSIVAGIALAVILGRVVWAIAASIRATRRARVVDGFRSRSWAHRPVHVLPLDLPEAYSVPGLRGQIVLTRGLLQLLDAEERRAVLLHEEGHLRSRHHLVVTLAKAVDQALSPLFPTGETVAGLEQAVEEAADDYAASKLGSGLAVATGVSKAALAGLEGHLGALSIGSGPDVPARVHRLLERTTSPGWIPLACFGGLAILVVVLAGTQLIAGFALVAAAHHLLGMGVASTCPLFR